MPPALLLKVPPLSETLPEIVPVLLIVTLPLYTATAWFVLVFPSRLAVIVPLLVRLAARVLPLLIWITGEYDEPSAVIAPELLIETTPLTPLATPVPVFAVIPTLLASVIEPLLMMVTLPPPCAAAFTPDSAEVIADELSRVRLTLPTPQL